MKFFVVCLTLILLFCTPFNLYAAEIIIPATNDWKYNYSSGDNGEKWKELDYDDSNWLMGNGIFGFGEDFIDTELRKGDLAYYFRFFFTLDSKPEDFTFLNLSAIYDDGFVVYINEQEALRSFMPASVTIDSITKAYNHESNGYEDFDITSEADSLVEGENIIAVEVHQAALTSSDLVWDMELTYSLQEVNITRGPYLQTGTSDSMIIRWRTSSPTGSFVRYGTDPDDLNNSTFDSNQTTEHEVRLTNLMVDTTYYYTVGDSTGILADSSFVTSPEEGTLKEVRIWVLGDSGTKNDNARDVRDAYYDYIDANHTDVVLMLGDNAYNSGTDEEYEHALFNMYGDLMEKTPFWPARGNHDMEIDGEIPYYNVFSLPVNGEAGGVPSGTETYYSFNYANVHFIVLDSVEYGGDIEKMLDWLEEDLESTMQRWTIAYWHHPPYTKGSHDSDKESDLIIMRQEVLPLLEKYGVDLVFSGHSHSYERSYLINGHYGYSTEYSSNPDLYTINNNDGRNDGDGAYSKAESSAGGGTVYCVAGSSGQADSGVLDHPVMLEFNDSRGLPVLGSVIVEVNGNQLESKFINTEGEILDHFTIVKKEYPLPDIKANHSDGPLTITGNASLTLSFELNAGDYDGFEADWWIVRHDPDGLWYTMDETLDWKFLSTDFYTVSQRELFHFDTGEWMTLSMEIENLIAGPYGFYFGIDLKMDGDVTWESLYYDYVIVNVE